jgi:hypothetical protein
VSVGGRFLAYRDGGSRHTGPVLEYMQQAPRIDQTRRDRLGVPIRPPVATKAPEPPQAQQQP